MKDCSNYISETFEVIKKFKQTILEVDFECLKQRGAISDDLFIKVKTDFDRLLDVLFDLYTHTSFENDSQYIEEKKLIQAEILPYVLSTKVLERIYAKPKGYSGDWSTILDLYENRTGDLGRIGPLLDQCWLESTSVQSVKNRRVLFRDLLLKMIEDKEGEPLHVTSFACGPAMEVFDVYEKISNPSLLKINLIDIDFEALSYIQDKCYQKGLKKQIRIINADLIGLAKGEKILSLPKQDLIYSIGLIDYLSDCLVSQLLNLSWSLLKSNGTVIIGNYHPRTRARGFMNAVINWKLNYRTEYDLEKIFYNSQFGIDHVDYFYEDNKFNLFARSIKSESSISNSSLGIDTNVERTKPKKEEIIYY